MSVFVSGLTSGRRSVGLFWELAGDRLLVLGLIAGGLAAASLLLDYLHNL